MEISYLDLGLRKWQKRLVFRFLRRVALHRRGKSEKLPVWDEIEGVVVYVKALERKILHG